MDPVFKYALNPNPLHHCLRTTLLPLTLGHVALLHGIESPLVEPGAKVSFQDVLLAVFICSCSHVKAAKVLRSRIRLTLAGWRLGFRARVLKPEPEVANFLEYLEDSYARPLLEKPKCKESRTMGAPLEWLLLDALMGDYHMTREQALHTPVIVAQCLWVTRGDREQRLSLAGDDITRSPETLVSYLYQRQRERQNMGAN